MHDSQGAKNTAIKMSFYRKCYAQKQSYMNERNNLTNQLYNCKWKEYIV